MWIGSLDVSDRERCVPVVGQQDVRLRAFSCNRAQGEVSREDDNVRPILCIEAKSDLAARQSLILYVQGVHPAADPISAGLEHNRNSTLLTRFEELLRHFGRGAGARLTNADNANTGCASILVWKF